jgi:hypothetical protein
MATILREYDSLDGRNVVCLFGTDELTLHFNSVPTDQERNEAIVIREQQMLDEAVDHLQLIETERVDNGILDW